MNIYTVSADGGCLKLQIGSAFLFFNNGVGDGDYELRVYPDGDFGGIDFDDETKALTAWPELAQIEVTDYPPVAVHDYDCEPSKAIDYLGRGIWTIHRRGTGMDCDGTMALVWNEIQEGV